MPISGSRPRRRQRWPLGSLVGRQGSDGEIGRRRRHQWSRKEGGSGEGGHGGGIDERGRGRGRRRVEGRNGGAEGGMRTTSFEAMEVLADAEITHGRTSGRRRKSSEEERERRRQRYRPRRRKKPTVEVRERRRRRSAMPRRRERAVGCGEEAEKRGRAGEEGWWRWADDENGKKERNGKVGGRRWCSARWRREGGQGRWQGDR